MEGSDKINRTYLRKFEYYSHAGTRWRLNQKSTGDMPVYSHRVLNDVRRMVNRVEAEGNAMYLSEVMNIQYILIEKLNDTLENPIRDQCPLVS